MRTKSKQCTLLTVVCAMSLMLFIGCSSDDDEAAGAASIETISTEIIGREIGNGDDFVVDFTINVTYPMENAEVQNFSRPLDKWRIDGNVASLRYLKEDITVERLSLMVDKPTSEADKARFTKVVVSANGKTYNLYVDTVHTEALIQSNQTSPVRITISN